MSYAFDIGDQPTLVVTFKNVGGTLQSPSSITFTVMDPAGTKITAPIGSATTPSTGVFHWTLPVIDKAGTWRVGARATAGILTAVEETFSVRDSFFD